MPKAIIGVSPTLSIEIEGATEVLLRDLAFWGSVPHQCPECDAPVIVSFRTPTAKQGARQGETFTYYGLVCTGPTPHECQISQRKESKGGGFFIREGNRKDGKPNWRAAFHGRDEDDEDEHQGSAVFAPAEQTKALEDMANAKGYAFPEMNKDCVKKWGVGYKQLSRDQAIEYLKTLRAL